MLDILVIAIIGLYAFGGWRKGLILSVLGIAGYILSAIIANTYSSQLTNYIINNTNIMNSIENAIGNGIKNVSQDPLANVASGFVSDIAANSLIGIISFIIIFSISSFIIYRIIWAINKVGSLPVISEFNKLGGLIFGVSKGLIIIFIGLALVRFVIEVGGDVKLQQYIANTSLVQFMYHANPIVSMIEGFFK